MHKVIIYTKETCPYCTMAKNLLEQKGIVDVLEIRVDTNPEELNEMIKKSGGRKTVPQIFIGNEHVGGFDDLSLMNRNGKLDILLSK